MKEDMGIKIHVFGWERYRIEENCTFRKKTILLSTSLQRQKGMGFSCTREVFFGHDQRIFITTGENIQLMNSHVMGVGTDLNCSSFPFAFPFPLK